MPPIDEQQEIVHRVDSLFTLAGVIEKHVADASARADKLTPVVLGKAFRGDLVSTEAELVRQEGRDYEPATVLVTRFGMYRHSSPVRCARRYRRVASRSRSSSPAAIQRALEDLPPGPTTIIHGGGRGYPTSPCVDDAATR